MILKYYNKKNLNSIITVKNNSVSVENFTDNMVFRAFGCLENPTKKDLDEFLESRCFPRTRRNVKDLLNCLGLDCYDPLEIIKQTKGRMAEDDCWLEVVE